MHRTDYTGAAADLHGAGKPGFTLGNPVGGIPASKLGADWPNAVQEEICNLIEAAGLALSKPDNTQLLQAIRALPGIHTELTIAGGTIAPTGSHHTVDTEGEGGADDLVTLDLTDVPEGGLVYLRAQDAARVVTVKHGTGNIQLRGQVDRALSTTRALLLQRVGGTVYEPAESAIANGNTRVYIDGGGAIRFVLNDTERWQINAAGTLSNSAPTGETRQFQCTVHDGTTTRGHRISGAPNGALSEMDLDFNDRDFFDFKVGGVSQGNIHVLGGVVSYGTFTGSHWSIFNDGEMPTIAPGTVLATVDAVTWWLEAERTVTEANGETHNDRYPYDPADPPNGLPGGLAEGDMAVDANGLACTIVREERLDLPQFKVSDAAADKRVYGVFAGWASETGDWTGIVHALGTGRVRVIGPCAGGDLLESAGDGTAQVQADDIVRASTIGKVTIGVPGAGPAEENLVAVDLCCG